MESEAQFVIFLIAPWAIALVALYLYRRRQARNAQDTDAAGDDNGRKD
ncbi:MAG: hypothetical protein QF609_07105 [Gammaproteobacteria bacterium]|jgi:hypothetical protein|nr:hypothetical protein [Gammaproteobacteria bacterium]